MFGNVPLRECLVCHTEKPLNQFPKKKSKQGNHFYCYDCWLSLPEGYMFCHGCLKPVKKYGSFNSMCCTRDCQNTWSRRYKSEHSEKFKDYRLNKYKTDKVFRYKHLAKTLNHRVKDGPRANWELVDRIINRKYCAYCGIDTSLPFTSPEIDHLIPVSKGGDNNTSNLVLTCRQCNQAKKANSLNEHLSWLKAIRSPVKKQKQSDPYVLQSKMAL